MGKLVGGFKTALYGLRASCILHSYLCNSYARVSHAAGERKTDRKTQQLLSFVKLERALPFGMSVHQTPIRSSVLGLDCFSALLEHYDKVKIDRASLPREFRSLEAHICLCFNYQNASSSPILEVTSQA